MHRAIGTGGGTFESLTNILEHCSLDYVRIRLPMMGFVQKLMKLMKLMLKMMVCFMVDRSAYQRATHCSARRCTTTAPCVFQIKRPLFCRLFTKTIAFSVFRAEKSYDFLWKCQNCRWIIASVQSYLRRLMVEYLSEVFSLTHNYDGFCNQETR